MKKTTLAIRINPGLKDRVFLEAKKQGWSVGTFADFAFAQYLKFLEEKEKFWAKNADKNHLKP